VGGVDLVEEEPNIGWVEIPTSLGWHEISNTDLQSECPPANFGGTNYNFSFSCQYVTNAWSSAAFDIQ